jgi:hypothetical protein
MLRKSYGRHQSFQRDRSVMSLDLVVDEGCEYGGWYVLGLGIRPYERDEVQESLQVCRRYTRVILNYIFFACVKNWIPCSALCMILYKEKSHKYHGMECTWSCLIITIVCDILWTVTRIIILEMSILGLSIHI